MNFLQSKAWEAFQRKLGHTTTRIDGQLAIQHTTPVGPYWYLARPVIDENGLNAIVAAALQAGVLFVRVDPSDQSSIINHQSSIAVRQTAPTQPQDSLILDLTPSEAELLASFHEKTRYNVRLAEKRGVTVEESSDVESFLTLARGTADRQAFRYHIPAYYRTMLETLRDGDVRASVLVAKADGRPVAANILLWASDTAYYLHGASSYEHRQFMAPHLLQWACIQAAKHRGCTRYDFWGIAPNAERSETYNLQPTTYNLDVKHPWAGITRFKLGFGGEVVHYPDSFDVVLNPTRYTIYKLGRSIRRQLPI